MADLGETIAALARGMGGAGLVTGRLKPVEAFGANPGGLAMLSYVPPGLQPGAPLVVVLHGCGQDAAGHAEAAGWPTLADRLGFAVLAPQQSAANNPNRCFNWFEPKDVTRGEGEAASIQAMVIHALAADQLDPARVFVTGLSAGGAMAAAMLATYPELFAGGAVVAGLPYGVASSLPEAIAAMRGGQSLPTAELAGRVRAAAPRPARPARLCIWHGERDFVVAPSAAEDLARQWAAVHELDSAAHRVDALSGRKRSRWLSAGGEVLIESHLLHGMGHGTPLATGGEDGLGMVAPFMLEAGISSALATAQFWGLAPRPDDEAPAELEAYADRAAPEPEGPKPAAGLGEAVLRATAPHLDPKVQLIIRKALQSAGLLRG